MSEPHRKPPASLQVEQVDSLIAAAGVEGSLTILDAFQRSTTDLLSVIETDLRQAALSEASRTAHAIKGSAANVGAAALADAASAIEIACKDNNAKAALANLENAQGLYIAFCDAFRAHLKQF